MLTRTMPETQLAGMQNRPYGTVANEAAQPSRKRLLRPAVLRRTASLRGLFTPG